MSTAEDLKVTLHEDIVYLMQMKKKYSLPLKGTKPIREKVMSILDTTITQLRDAALEINY